MKKITAALLMLMLPLGVVACGDDKEGNADALASRCQEQLDASGSEGIEEFSEDICRCYGDNAAEEYSTDELNDLLAEGNEEEGAAALLPVLQSCAADNGVELGDSGE